MAIVSVGTRPGSEAMRVGVGAVAPPGWIEVSACRFIVLPSSVIDVGRLSIL
jgi:hypothetical protein